MTATHCVSLDSETLSVSGNCSDSAYQWCHVVADGQAIVYDVVVTET